MSPSVTLLLFLMGIVGLACTLLGGLYFLIRHEPTPTNKPPKRFRRLT